MTDPLFDRLARALDPEFRVVREVGRGGMGVVYLAREVVLDRDVAVKLLPPELGADPSLADRFLAEARTAARLDHPHIVPVYQVLQRDGLSLFTMKFVSGASLHSVLRARGALTFDEVRRILRACAEALAYAHRAGVVHRDVKPGNVLVDDSGWVYVTDFGIAKAIAEDTPSTRSGAVMGTPHYLAPELCRGGRADALTDQYALGVVGYQMLCGRLPWEGDTVEALLAQRLFSDPPPIRRFRPDVPADLEVAVERALRRDRGARFRSLVEMAEFLGAEPRTPRSWRGRRRAQAEEVPTVPLRWEGRWRRWVRSGAAGLGAVGVVAAGSLWAFGRSGRPPAWPEVGGADPAASVSAGPPPPAVPEPALARIAQRLDVGRVWLRIGRYHDATLEFEAGLADLRGAAARYAPSHTLDSLETELLRAAEEARRGCVERGWDCAPRR